MIIFDWPSNLIPTDVQIRPPRKTVGMTTSLTQFSQAVPAIRPPFRLTLTFGNLFDDQVRAWRAIEASLEGRTNAVRIPLFDVWHRAKDSAIGAHLVPFSDGATFADGAQHSTPDLQGVLVSGVQGQRTITADFGDNGELLEAGLFFGLGDHPYAAGAVWWDGSVATIRCNPTLRKTYTDQLLRLKPVMIGRLLDDDGMNIALTRARYGAPTIELEETFDVLLP